MLGVNDSQVRGAGVGERQGPLQPHLPARPEPARPGARPHASELHALHAHPVQPLRQRAAVRPGLDTHLQLSWNYSCGEEINTTNS